MLGWVDPNDLIAEEEEEDEEGEEAEGEEAGRRPRPDLRPPWGLRHESRWREKDANGRSERKCIATGEVRPKAG